LTIPAEPIRSARRRRDRLAGILAAFLSSAFATAWAGAAQDVAPLVLGQSVEVDPAPGATRAFSLRLSAGEYFQLAFSPDSAARVTVELRDPEGRVEQTAEVEATQVLCGIAQSAGDYSLGIRRAPDTQGNLEVAREIGRPTRPGDVDLCRGERAFWQGRGEEKQGAIAPALASYDRALAAFEQAGDLTGQVKALFRAGRALYFRREPGDAKRGQAKYDQALPLADRLANAAATDRLAASACASLWGNVGLLLRDRGDAQGAEALYARAVEVARAWPKDLDLAQRLQFLGYSAAQAGDREKALRSYLEAVSLAQEEPPRRALSAQVEIGIGQMSDRLESALAHYDVAASLAPDDPEIAFLARHERCVALFRFGAFGEALSECQLALALTCDSRTAKADEAASFNTLGSLFVDLGSYEKASAHFERARQIFSEIGTPGPAGDAQLNRGVAQLALGQFDQAVQSFEQTLAVAREANDAASAGLALTQLGKLELERPNGDPARARQLLTEALALAERSNAPALEADARLELASAEARLGNSEGGLAQLVPALALAESLGDPVRRASVLTRRAEVLYARNELEAALAAVDQAAGLIDGLRTQATPGLRASFLARRRRTFELQIEILMRLHEAKPDAGYDAKAFEASESARARSLLDLLAERRAGGENSPTARALTAEQVHDALAPGDLLLEYLRSERATFLFAVTRDRLAAFRLDATAIDGSLRPFTASLANPQSVAQGIRLRATALYRVLLGPVTEFLTNARRVIVAADGDLYDLPFETLVAPATSGGRSAYLIESRTISYVPSASTLAHLGELPLGNGPEFLGFAAPEAGGGLPYLPLVEEEVRRIAALFPERSRIFLSAEATEVRFRSENALVTAARRLHFAAHGYLSEDPELMGIHLSRDPAHGSDGLLQAFEILGLDLHADLVVLSACETARGQRIPGEGTLGLPRAFFYAGARTVVVSLWRAEDSATAALMVAFYRALSRGVDKAEALRQAKLERIAAGDVPRLWAPFVLVGSPVR
jgi:CHAT domain-containing protein/Tfp pilus assembly protein PilF